MATIITNSKTRLVVKYGGSSLADFEKMNKIADRLIEKKKEYEDLVCVVSAMGDTTDQLIARANNVATKPNSREMDMLISTGEQMSASLLAMALNHKGYKAMSMTGLQAGFKTYGEHRESRIDSLETDRIEEALSEGYIVIVAGFQGMNERGDITTLGRGGSDTSAVALAAKLNSGCHIYTDVDGIYTVDPRIFPEAKKLDYISYEETLEMANLGAKVLQARSVLMAQKYNVPLYIGHNGEAREGSYIVKDNMVTERRSVTSLSVKDDLVLSNLHLKNEDSKIASEIFKGLADENIKIDIVSQIRKSEERQLISFTSEKSKLTEIKDVLNRFKIDYEIKEDLAKLSLVGNGMRNEPKILAKIFEVFSEKEIPFYQISTSEISISYVIDLENVSRAVMALAGEFDL